MPARVMVNRNDDVNNNKSNNKKQIIWHKCDHRTASCMTLSPGRTFLGNRNSSKIYSSIRWKQNSRKPYLAYRKNAINKVDSLAPVMLQHSKYFGMGTQILFFCIPLRLVLLNIIINYEHVELSFNYITSYFHRYTVRHGPIILFDLVCECMNTYHDTLCLPC